MAGRLPAGLSQPIPIRPAPEPEIGSTPPRLGVPVPLGQLVGREEELEALRALLDQADVRLVTLTGPGGVGKTRLALELAERVATAFDGGVTFVPLAAVTDHTRVMTAVARAYELPDIADTPVERQIAAAAHGARRLLILDNFEHVAAAAASVAELATLCPTLTILTTSRLRLRLHGEHEFRVSPLPLPPTDAPPEALESDALAQNPAVALFVLRSVAAKPDFALTAVNAAAVAELCHRLDGLPLAIELAAARSGVLSLQSMLARLSGRLQLLSDGPVDAPARLRTMRDVVAWSLDLLSDDAATLFRRLAIFAGPVSIDAVEAIGGEIPVLPALTALVDAALLQQMSTASGAIHFRMLETVREVARERLREAGESEATNLILAEWCRRFILEAEREIHGGGQDRWFAFFTEEQETFRSAIAWAVSSGKASLALRLVVGPLWFLWSMKGWTRSEHHWLDAAMALAATADPPVDQALRAKAHFDVAIYFLNTGDYSRARIDFEESLRLCHGLPNAEQGSLFILANLGILDLDQGHYADARGRFETVLEARRRLGDPSGTARVLVNLGNCAIALGDHAAATRCFDEALPIIRQTGERRMMAHCLNGLGEVAAGLGRDAEALASFDQALGLFRQADDLTGEGATLVNLAAVALGQGDLPRAAAALAEVLEQQREAKAPMIVADALNGAAAAVIAGGQPRLGPQLLAAATAIRSSTQTVPIPAVRRRVDRTVGAAKAALGLAGYDAAVIAGRSLTTDDAMERARNALLDLAPRPIDVATGDAADPDSVRASLPSTPIQLTQRQREVLRGLVAGMTDPEIADELGIGARTVESHVATILNKLRVHARTAAVAYAVRHGLG